MPHSKHAGLEIIRAYIEGQAQLGYADFHPGPRPNDIVLVTFPKSGSTWTSYMLQQIRSAGSDDFDDIKNEVVDITPGHWLPENQPFIHEQRFFPRTYKTHGSYLRCPKGAKYIYISRNPRDIFWSFYKFLHDLLAIEERVPVDLFYRHVFRDRFDSGHDIGNVWDHLVGWHSIRNETSMLWMHYEDLVADRQRGLKIISEFMGVKLSEKIMQRVVIHSGMEHMRRISARINPSPDNYVGRIVAGFGDLTSNYARQMKFGKLRRGVPGDGKLNIPVEIDQEFDLEWRTRVTPKLGYANYKELCESGSLFR